MPDLKINERTVHLVSLALVLFAGIFLRLPPSLFSAKGAFHSIAALHPNPKWHNMQLVGFDEDLYRGYVDELKTKGITHYPDIVVGYIEKQVKLPASILPPVRFLFIFAAYAWQSVFGGETLEALKNVASFFSILTLMLAATFAWRVRPDGQAVAVSALVAFAPTQLHMSQHALVDGFFTFWALLTLWTLWESLRSPRNWGWLVAYMTGLTCLVLTKENAFFVFVGIVAVIGLNRWLLIGTVT